MRRSIHPGDLFAAIYDHGYGAFAHLMREYPESAVQRAFEQARRQGDIECDGKMSQARLTERWRTSVEISRSIRHAVNVT